MRLGIFIIMTVVVLGGAGYLLLGSARSSVTVENPVVTDNRESAADSGEQVADNGQKVAQTSTNEQQSETDDAKPSLVGSLSKSETTEVKTSETKTAGAVDFTIKNRLISFGFEKASGRMIDTIVLHSSYNNTGGGEYSVDSVIGIWKSYGVAPHYLIDRKGNVYRLVEDKNIAYHAGVSQVPDGRTDVNKFSIGIEMLNSLDDKYTDAQYKAVHDLAAYLKGKYEIKYVLGHDDIAPGRKTDPWNFDWKKLK